MRLTALPQTHRTAPAAVIAEGVRSPHVLELGMTTFLVEHPQARFLVDPALWVATWAVINTVERDLATTAAPSG